MVKVSDEAGTYVSTGLVTEGVGPGTLINSFFTESLGQPCEARIIIIFVQECSMA